MTQEEEESILEYGECSRQEMFVVYPDGKTLEEII